MTPCSDHTTETLTTNPLALVIEDDRKLATIFAIALERAEFEVEVILDGRSAMDRLAITTPAMVVLDMHLPYISGKDILQEIRTNTRLAKTRVILATADALIADILKEEADLVLLKPISFNQLRDLAVRLRSADAMG